MRTRSVDRVEGAISEALEGHAAFVPSARLGLAIVLERLLRPGDGVALTSACCETVPFALWAAGVRPTFVDSDPATGNLDCDLLETLEAPGVRAVLAMHLYGVPDDLPRLQAICARRGWTLVEDCAHVLDSRVDGARAGTFGEAAVWSFPKTLAEAGGAVTCRDGALADAVRRRTRGLAHAPRSRSAATRSVQRAVDRCLPPLGRAARAAMEGGRALRRRLSPAAVAARPWRGSRLDPGVVALASARRLRGSASADGHGDGDGDGGGDGDGDGDALTASLARLRPLLHVAHAGYDRYPPPALLRRLEGALRSIPERAERQRAANAAVLEAICLERPHVPARFDPCHLVVPFFSDHRDHLRRCVWRKSGLKTAWIYDPPLPGYLPPPTFVDLRRMPDRDRRWCERLFPVPAATGSACAAAMATCRLARHGRAHSQEICPC